MRSLEDTDISAPGRTAQSLGRIDPEWTTSFSPTSKSSKRATHAPTPEPVERSRTARATCAMATATAKNKEEAEVAQRSPSQGAFGSASFCWDPMDADLRMALCRRSQQWRHAERLDSHRSRCPSLSPRRGEVRSALLPVAERLLTAIAKDHIDKMDKLEIERLAKLRASYTYSISYKHKPKFAFEMAWRWIMDLKAQASGSMQLPTTTVDTAFHCVRRSSDETLRCRMGRGVEV